MNLFSLLDSLLNLLDNTLEHISREWRAVHFHVSMDVPLCTHVPMDCKVSSLQLQTLSLQVSFLTRVDVTCSAWCAPRPVEDHWKSLAGLWKTIGKPPNRPVEDQQKNLADLWKTTGKLKEEMWKTIGNPQTDLWKTMEKLKQTCVT